MRLVLFLIFCPCVLLAQTYTTTTQGKNTVGGAYVAPVVTKTYTFKSSGYQPPVRTSYNSYQYKSVGSSSSSSSSSTSSSGGGGSIQRAPKGAPFKDENGKYGYKTGRGIIMLGAIYDEIGDYSEAEYDAYLWVKKDGKFGIHWYSDKKPTIPVKYDEIKKINSYLVMVKKDGKYGMIQFIKAGNPKTTIPIKYDDMGPFNSFSLWVKSDDKIGLLSTVNTTLLPVKFEEIRIFSEKLVIVKQNNKMGLMDYRNDVVLPLEYDHVSSLSGNVSWVLQNSKWGLINSEGTVLAQPQYDEVYEQSNGNVWVHDKAVVSKAGKLVYIKKDGKEEVPIEEIKKQ